MKKKKMNSLLKEIECLKKEKTKKLVKKRIKEFEELGKKDWRELFKELCFCILTANYNAEKGIKIQKKAGNCFLAFPEKKLARKLKALGHRFPNTRAKYIAEARKLARELEITTKMFWSEAQAREWLVKNIKGLGYKEASHFLRNIGFKNLAIIDFHIADNLARHGLIKKQKTLSRKKYLEIEQMLKEIAEKSRLSLAELDLYMWYAETGKVLK